MIEKYHKFLKLSNGEDIIATTDNDCKDFKNQKSIFVYDPVQINTIRIAQGDMLVESFTMQPWIKLAKSDIIEIPTESIVVAVDLDDKVVTQYEIFLDEYTKQPFERVDETQFDEFLDDYESEQLIDGIRREEEDEEGPTFH